MFSIADHLKNWLTTSKVIITQPRHFFRDMPTSGGYREPLGFAAVTVLIISVFYAPILLVLMSLPMDIEFVIIGLVALFLYSFFSMMISIPVNGILHHILFRVYGGKGSLEATIRVFCYYMAISLVVLPVVFVIVLFFYLAETAGLEGAGYSLLSIVLLLSILVLVSYSFYVLFAGFSQVHQISMKRVVLATFSIPTVLFLILAILAVTLVFISGYYVT